MSINDSSRILSHNHPSGNLKPSRADEELTAKINEAAKYNDIKILDHIIVTSEGYYSFADEGLPHEMNSRNKKNTGYRRK